MVDGIKRYLKGITLGKLSDLLERLSDETNGSIERKREQRG